jgi:hypothetical protein
MKREHDIEEALRQAMHKSGRSIKSMADNTSLSYSPVHRFYTGQGSMTLTCAAKLCRLLGLELHPQKRGGK